MAKKLRKLLIFDPELEKVYLSKKVPTVFKAK